MDYVGDIFSIAVIIAFFAGGSVSIIAFGCAFRGFRARTDPLEEISIQRRQYWRDACGIITGAVVLQAAILLLPLLYRSPGEVPRQLAEGAIMATASLVVLWAWAFVCLFRAGSEVMYRSMSRWTALIWSLPIACSLIALTYTH